MSTIAVVGAGPLLGRSVATAFGRRGFNVALIARRNEALSERARELTTLGITASGFSADVRDSGQLTAALADARQKFGSIDVLEYSPTEWGNGKLYPALETTAETALDHFKLLVLGAITCVEQVLPHMLASGRGTLLFTTGTSSHHPLSFITSLGIANAGLRNYARCLAEELKPKGVYVGTLAIGVAIARDGTKNDPDKIADVLWDMHEKQNRVDETYM